MAEVTCKTGLMESLKNKNIILDTCILIELARCQQLMDMFMHASNTDGCTFMITGDVYHEFISQVRKRAELERNKKLMKTLAIGTIQGVDAFCMTPAGEAFLLCLNNIKDREGRQRSQIIKKNAPEYKPSIIDKQLLFLATTEFFNRRCVLLTSNFSDVPLCLFENCGTITIADDAGVRNISAYVARQDEITMISKNLE